MAPVAAAWSSPVIIGREAERRLISEMLDRSRRGGSDVVFLIGPPGIGKTALLEEAARMAEGFRVMRARGVEQEAELPFSGLHELLSRAMDDLPESSLPDVKDLSNAFGLGRPTVRDRFAVGVATLNVLAALAEREPILVLVDDMQWLDAASAEAILFAVRRLDSEGVVVLLAGRERPTGGRSGIREHHVEGLDAIAAARILRGWHAGPVQSGVVEALVRATGGNPLALREAATLLDDAQLAGVHALDDPPAVGLGSELAFAPTISRLPESVQTAVAALAALGSHRDLALLGAVLTSRGLGLGDLEPAEAAGVVELDGNQVEFRHPLFRSAAYHSVGGAERRSLHAAIARLGGAFLLGDAYAWHLAAAALGPDEAAAVALETVARRQAARNGHVAASLAYARAAGLSADTSSRLRRLTEAARAAYAGGHYAAAERHAADAFPLAQHPNARADLRCISAKIAESQGRLLAARDILVEEATRVETMSRQRAALMLLDAAMPSLWSLELEPGVPDARQAYALANATGSTHQAQGAIVTAMVLLGRLDEARPGLDEWHRRVRSSDDLLASESQALTLARVLVWTEVIAAARRLLERLVADARRSAPSELPLILEVLAELEWRDGRWGHGHAAASEGVELAEQMCQSLAESRCLAIRARYDAAMGRQDDCREAVQRLQALREELTPEIWTRGLELPAVGLRALAEGDAEQAAASFGSLASLAAERQVRHPGAVPHHGDLIESMAMLGRIDEARRALAGLDQRAREADCNGALAVAARCRGLLAGEEFEDHFALALELHDRRPPQPFERARTQLLLAERRRRAGRRRDARGPLRDALSTFEDLAAAPWAARATAELRATGETVRARRTPSVELTPQELRIALAVADGATNREVASALFLSAKTVEYHLTKVYEKLGVRSRTELARTLDR